MTTLVKIRKRTGVWWITGPLASPMFRMHWRDAMVTARSLIEMRADWTPHPEHLADRVHDLVVWGWSLHDLHQDTGIPLRDLVLLDDRPLSQLKNLQIPEQQAADLLTIYRREAVR